MNLCIIMILTNLCISVVSLTIAIKIIAVRIIKTLDSYLNKYDAQIMDLIRWAKGLDKHQ